MMNQGREDCNVVLVRGRGFASDAAGSVGLPGAVISQGPPVPLLGFANEGKSYAQRAVLAADPRAWHRSSRPACQSCCTSTGEGSSMQGARGAWGLPALLLRFPAPLGQTLALGCCWPLQRAHAQHTLRVVRAPVGWLAGRPCLMFDVSVVQCGISIPPLTAMRCVGGRGTQMAHDCDRRTYRHRFIPLCCRAGKMGN